MFLSRTKKNNVYPCKPQFYYIKVGFKGVKIYKRVFVMNLSANITKSANSSHRLRLECSSLNQHLCRKNLVDSPNCSCGMIESSSHFLLSCARKFISDSIIFFCFTATIDCFSSFEWHTKRNCSKQQFNI